MKRVSKGFLFGKPYQGFLRSKNLLIVTIRTLAYSFLIMSITGATLWYEGEIASFDYVLALDSSTSMMADDLLPIRMEAVKDTAIKFIDYTPRGTKIGLVSFSSVVFEEQELSDDKSTLKDRIGVLGIKKTGGTNLGDTIITASNMFEEGGPNAIVLMTDGRSNTGTIVEDAVDYARKKNVKIFTIGIGTEEGGKIAGVDFVSDLDEQSLEKIAELSEGTYFRTKSKEDLENSFKEIASVKTARKSFDLSLILIFIGLAMLFLEEILINTKYKTVP
jgi:Ca-activated chloride channel family protein